MIMREKGKQAENGNDVELHLLRSVCNPIRKRMDREEEHSQANHAQQHEPSRNMQEHVSLARRRNKERQVTGGYRVGRHCHARGASLRSLGSNRSTSRAHVDPVDPNRLIGLGGRGAKLDTILLFCLIWIKGTTDAVAEVYESWAFCMMPAL